ncbi:hypothetical protein [Xenorhabdus griffiniae]|uniref:N-acetyltransferase n=1 Tax=Xenorhabdus griffiniae TaxID=351672 RepID=A0ABY9XM87_9GAMM|nr:hypothetical protein [Xenorhabdus griffiniae]MBD1228311.1 hypothetical protein [Xenorhabdus griffiniae]MBE8587748.1 hypothetical protein [Xenorhabdus griffiniae]WMV74052.1 hypothetical protein QL128_08680 [Xenorhabdus griffiniae]WNH03732.1 hypothetical protein QL112_008685 [Xenorhabdus griffiniae]
MFNLEHIGIVVRNNIQAIVDVLGLNLAVGDISDEDYFLLSQGYGELCWDDSLSRVGNRSDKFEFCIKLVECGNVQGAPAGLALCVYSVDEKTFEIHMIENFRREDKNHPLYGKMFQLTLMAAYLFCKSTEGEYVRVIEPVKEVIPYYESYGFNMLGCGYIMEVNVANIETVFKKLAT